MNDQRKETKEILSVSDCSQNKNNEKYLLAPVSVRLSPDRHPKPIITCLFSEKENIRGWVLIDTGATVSLINQQALTADNHRIVGRRTRKYFGAGGSELPLGDYLVDVQVFVVDYGVLEVKNAIVCKGRKSTNTILLGTPDIRRLGLVLDYSQNKIIFNRSNLRGLELRMPTMQALASANRVFEEMNLKQCQKVNDPISAIFENMINMINTEYSACEDINECETVDKNVALSSLNGHEVNKNCEDIDECKNLTCKNRDDCNEVAHDDLKQGKDVENCVDINECEKVKKCEDIEECAIKDKNSKQLYQSRLKLLDLYESVEDPSEITENHQVASDGYSTLAILGDPCIANNKSAGNCTGCDECIDPELKAILLKGGDNPPSFDNPNIDKKTALLAYIERLRERDKNTFTHEKCTISPEMEKKDPELAAAIKSLIKKHKKIFAKDIGRLGPEFQVRGHINEKSTMNIQRPGHSPFQDDMLVAVMKQFAKLLAHGVIRPIEDLQIEPKNVLMVLPVKKKDDDGNVLNILNALRLVVNSKPANKHTDFCGAPTDNLSDAINFAARTSKDGLNAKVDISKAYFNIPLHESLYPYFCIDVPIIGRCHFTVMVQGWSPAAQICQDVFSKLFFTLKDYTKKYMDDFVLATPNCRLTYLNKLNQFFTICSRNNLRLSGDKSFFCVQEMNYLGVKISHGKIIPSEHYILKLKNIKIENITTKKKLKSFIASLRFLARFQHRSTEVLKKLNDEVKGQQNELVKWTDDLRNEFHKALKALDELSELHPFEPAAPTVLVVDTSLIATGGFMYQIGPEGPKLIQFFSRTRRDKERKTPISSCHMEMLGLKAMIHSFIEMLRQCTQTVTVVTDSRAVVKVFEKYKKGDIPSADTILNNALYSIVSVLNVNVIHANNTNTNIKFSDDMSRLGLFVSNQVCSNNPKCSICQAADPNNTDFNKVLNAVQDNFKIGQNHGNIFVNSIQDGIDLPRDSVIFQAQHGCNDRCCSLKEDFKKVKLRELLENSELILKLQLKDKVFKRLYRDLGLNVLSYAKTDQKLQTLLKTRNAKIERGYICIDKNIDGIIYRVIPLPSQYAILAITAVHNTIGHSSAAQLYKHTIRYFQIEKLREKISQFVKNCVKCTLLRGGGGYNRMEQKPVPLPKSLYHTILVDEVTRTFRGTNLKFLLGMEALSGFIVCVVYSGSMTSSLFLQILCQIKVLLCPFNMDKVSMTVRCDRATWHTSTILKTSLSKLNIDLQLYHSTTNSKNVIPELDARIKIFSQYLVQIVEDSPFDLVTCCHLATAKTNNSISKSNLSPAETFVGRTWKDGKQIRLEVSELIEKVKSRRKDKREYEERKAAERYLGKELSKVPYRNQELNSPLVNNPELLNLAAGDIVTLKEQINKNEPRCAYTVIELDFKKQLVLLQRTSGQDSREGEKKWISFKLIHTIHKENDVVDDFLSETIENNQILQLENESEIDCHHSLGLLNDLSTVTVLNNIPMMHILHLEIE